MQVRLKFARSLVTAFLGDKIKMIMTQLHVGKNSRER